MSSEKIVYAEKYGKNGPKILPEHFPKLSHTNSGFKVAEVRITAMGRVEKDGKMYEFHDLHILLEEL